MKTYFVPTTKERKPIKYWQAIRNNVVIDENNSIALLRHKYGNVGIRYQSVR